MLNTRICYAVLFLIGICTHLVAMESYHDPISQRIFSKQLIFNGQDHQQHTLQLTGVTVRSKFFVNVYTMAHYMEEPSTGNPNEIFRDILSDNGKIKAAVAYWLINAPLKNIKEGYRDTFQKYLTRQQVHALSDTIDQFLSFYQTDLKAMDQTMVRWLPEGTLEVFINGNFKGSVTSPEMALALWTPWFGPKSIIDRQELIALISNRNR